MVLPTNKLHNLGQTQASKSVSYVEGKIFDSIQKKYLKFGNKAKSWEVYSLILYWDSV